MNLFKTYKKEFAWLVAVLFVAFIPVRCFAREITEAESRVYRERLIAECKKYVGTPYVRGAVGPDAFDCSGLIYTVAHDSIEYQLPRTVKAMYSKVKIVPNDKKEPGDLLFFKTTGDGTISHVGLYIGNGQFISALSDGPNTGVIVSSLREGYWKGKYVSCGKFLPEAGLYEVSGASATRVSASKTSKKSSADKKSYSSSRKTKSGINTNGSYMTCSGNGSFADHLAFAAYATADWSLFTEKKFMPNFRGLSTEGDVIYRGKMLSPGLGLLLRWNDGVKAFQMPVIASLYVGDYFRAYAGPMFSFGNCQTPEGDDSIKASVFPGIIGVTFSLPSFTQGDFKVQLVQDICYSVYNNESNAALSFLKSASAGLEFCTGVRIFFPLSSVSKK
ncbi:MAG: C40 family peptidase [Treponema sp.]|nr:C40 family peptidase [Treponema sp.]